MGDLEMPQSGVSATLCPIFPASALQTSAIAEGSTEAPKPLSKTAIKKAAKAERLAALKSERRAREKEAKKEKKRQRAAKRAAGELDTDDEPERHKKKARVEFGGRVVVDLGFDDKMNEKEITSLCSQLAYTYSVNRNASFPFSLIYTSLNGRTFTRLEGMSDASYKRWVNTEWWQEGYEQLWLDKGPSITDPSHVEGSSKEREVYRQNSGLPRQTEIQKTIVYLTADSEDELAELKPDETYVIGGICDHNRYKNLCLNKAKESGIRTARLPIGRYLASLPTRKVLTVNQVFEILVKWVEVNDWEEALYSVIPKRKFQTPGRDRSDATKSNTEGGDPNDAREERNEEEEDPLNVQEVELIEGRDRSG